MSPTALPPAARRTPRGLTLVELLLVAAILAIVAGGAVILAGGTEEQARADLARSEIQAVRDAYLAFERDLGALPGTGPFALAADGGAEPEPSAGADWFRSPANVVQLLERPQSAAAFDLHRGRGWRGPYVRMSGEGLVAIRDRIQPDGSVAGGAGTLLADVPAVADPWEHPPVAVGAGAEFSWKLGPARTPVPRHGRPYLLLDRGDRARARIVSFGANGVYECADVADPATWGDDLVEFLHR